MKLINIKNDNKNLQKTLYEYTETVNRKEIKIQQLQSHIEQNAEEINWLNDNIKELKKTKSTNIGNPKAAVSINAKGISNTSNSDVNGRTYIGTFTATAYCGCKQCNGKWYGYPAKNGEKMQEGMTIAVDPSVIPLNSYVYIEGYGTRKAQDTGGSIKGNKIDIYFSSHDKTKAFGKRTVKVYK